MVYSFTYLTLVIHLGDASGENMSTVITTELRQYLQHKEEEEKRRTGEKRRGEYKCISVN